MVVLSAAILTKTKTLLARQFVEMTRLRVEGLLSAFPKLIETGVKDHTYIETDSVRYVYQPVESLYILLVTNKASNILEDLETLRLMAKIVQDCCQISVNEESVLKNAFNIIFSLDEVISFGYRESVTLSQIKTYTEMESHEEKLHQMIEQSKMNDAREQAKRKQQELTKLRLQGKAPAGDSVSSQSAKPESFKTDEPITTPIASTSMATLSAASGGMDSIKAPAPKKGMQIGKKKPTDILESLRPPGAAAPSAGDAGIGGGAAAAIVEADQRAAPAFNPLLEPVSVTIEEKVQVSLQAEGGLNDLTVDGTFEVRVLDAAKADLAAFKISPEDKRFKYKAHPNLNKASQANNILEPRDASRAFRANVPAPLLKWRCQTTNEDMLPITISCWPSPSADGTTMVIEYELQQRDLVLTNVRVRIPCPKNGRPQVLRADLGEVQPLNEEIVWVIPVIDEANGSGSMEFSAKTDKSALFPVGVEAVALGRTVSDMKVLECFHASKKESINYATAVQSVYNFVIGA